MADEIPNSVKCRITGVEHKVVHGETNKKELNNYLSSLITRMNHNEKINIAIDCEGWVLGIKENSLGLVQFAECFTPSFLESRNFENISINLKPGFLIKAPIDKKTAELMSTVFGHRNMTLITFDFTCDIAALNEAGIKFNMRNVIDAQPNRLLKGIESITFNRFQGLKSVCMNATNCVEFEAAEGALNDKKSMDFNYIYYTNKDSEHPFDDKLDAQFWEYASSDIALTAIALASRLGKIKAHFIKRNSYEKTKAYVELQQKEGLRAPAFVRQYSFIGRGFLLSEITQKADAYKLYAKADVILEKFELYERLVEANNRCTKEEILEQQRKAVEFINA